jgi:drug/metabolite transporter (DMT)-like permease
MEIWAIYAIGASLLWAFVNISDKYLVTKYKTGRHTSGALVLFSSLIGLLISFLILLFTGGVGNATYFDKALLLFTGGLSVIWIMLYLFSLEVEEVSSVVPWFLTIPAFGYIFGYFFLGEDLTSFQKLGSLIVLLGLVLLHLNYDGRGKISFKPKVFWYMMFACIIIAIQGILFKYVTVVDYFWISSFWQYLGLGLSGVLILIFVPKYRRGFTHMYKVGGKQILTLNISSELVTTAGNLLASFATLLAPVTIVYLLESFQPAFVLLLTVLGTVFFPKIITENISKKALVPKIIAIAAMIAGSYILFL